MMRRRGRPLDAHGGNHGGRRRHGWGGHGTTRSRSTPTRQRSSRPSSRLPTTRACRPPSSSSAAARGAQPRGLDMEQLKQLGELHTAGVLSDEEFAAAKAKLLG